MEGTSRFKFQNAYQERRTTITWRVRRSGSALKGEANTDDPIYRCRLPLVARALLRTFFWGKVPQVRARAKDEAYVNRTVYDVPKALLNEFLLENGCPDYSAVVPAIIDLMPKAVEERKIKS